MRVAVYARYSSDLSRDASIEDQVRLCRAYAERAGWTVTEVFEDRAISGASTIRPGYQRLLERCCRAEFDIVLAEALDRLSRDQEDIAALHKRLRFLGVQLVTVSEGEIGDLHIGFKGAMNAMYLKDLADKTRRGLEGRVRAGRSGGGLCYGYDVVSGEERGGRTINADEAAIVRRIFEAFAAGQSPKAIARQLNVEGVPAARADALARHRHPRPSDPRHRDPEQRALYWAPGLEPAALHQGPADRPAGLAAQSSESEWIIEDVPELRIIDDALWDRVKARQAELDASPRVQKIKASGFWEHRRPVHLLTGLVRCGQCGGSFIAAGRDYLACGTARKLDRCDQRKAIRRPVLEEFVLDLIRDRMMQPDAVKAFVEAYTQRDQRRT